MENSTRTVANFIAKTVRRANGELIDLSGMGGIQLKQKSGVGQGGGATMELRRCFFGRIRQAAKEKKMILSSARSVSAKSAKRLRKKKLLVRS